MMLPQLILTVFLCIATWTDIRKREIPIWIAILTAIAILLIHFFQKKPLEDYLIAFIILGLLYLLGAMFITGSGGDIFLMITVGITWGMVGSLFIVAISSFISIIYAVFQKLMKNTNIFTFSYPLAPFVLVSHCIILSVFLYRFF